MEFSFSMLNVPFSVECSISFVFFTMGFCRSGQSSAGTSDSADNRGVKRKAEDSDSEPEPEDNVR